ncbi:MAG: HlyD family efflux transporter periplasmic adaptor subunit [Phaeodactylibacter sp.]|nr:HlyD family efflux transporter periplasmic adaptor subunit [Phaeodactylibacter sp.]
MPRQSFDNANSPDTERGRTVVQEILGRPPGWAMRWGITAVFLAVLLILGCAWLIRYPDWVMAEVMVVTPEPAIRIVAPKSGRLQQLMVQNGANVEGSRMLAMMENPASLDEVNTLKRWTDKDSGIIMPPPDLLSLGAIQPLMAELRRSWDAYNFFLKRGDFAQRIASLERQREQLHVLGQALEQKQKGLEKELALATANFKRNEALAATGNVSELDKEQAELTKLKLEREVQDVETQLLQNDLEAERNRIVQITLQQEQLNSAQTLRQSYEANRANLLSALEAWFQNNTLRAETPGVVSFHQPVAAGQYFEEGQLIMTILPASGNEEALVRGYLPVKNAGRVITGMPVRLFLDAYPEQQYGALIAEVSHVSAIPEQQSYYVECRLTNGMLTTYGREIPFAQELSAQARIITDDRRLLQRIFNQLKSLWENY